MVAVAAAAVVVVVVDIVATIAMLAANATYVARRGTTQEAVRNASRNKMVSGASLSPALSPARPPRTKVENPMFFTFVSMEDPRLTLSSNPSSSDE